MTIGILHHDPVAADMLRRVLTSGGGHELVWTARTAGEAVRLVVELGAELVLIALPLAGMSGAEATRRILASAPCAILIVTPSVRANAGAVFEAMGHGAFDAVDLPADGAGGWPAGPLLAKVSTISKLLRDRNGSKPRAGHGRVGAPMQRRLLAIGASAGGPAAVATLLGGLPSDLDAAIVVVQHVDERFTQGLAEWLSRSSGRPVRVAEEGDAPGPGTVLIAGTSQHLVLKTPGRLGYTAEPHAVLYRPSVDVFFRSVSLRWPGAAAGVLLTGMGRDGALGLRALRNKGHFTVAQDEVTSAVYGMPKEAVALGAAVTVLPVDRIAQRMVQLWHS
jgi:chemotaxis response regulator CheB